MSNHGPIISLLEHVGLALRSLSAAEIAPLLFTRNIDGRVFLHLPQIRSVAHDRDGASAVSLTKLGMFALSHLSATACGLFVVGIFGANTLCCVAGIGFTAGKRAQGPVRPTLMDEARLRARKM